MTGNYLTLLEESLRRKLQVMEEIQKYNMRQQEIFQSGEVDIDKFDEYVAEKGVLRSSMPRCRRNCRAAGSSMRIRFGRCRGW